MGFSSHWAQTLADPYVFWSCRWGINSEEEIASFLKSVHKALKPGGYLIIGFNRHMISCCGFDPYFEPSPMGELPQKKDFDGHWQHTYEIFRRTSHA